MKEKLEHVDEIVLLLVFLSSLLNKRIINILEIPENHPQLKNLSLLLIQ